MANHHIQNCDNLPMGIYRAPPVERYKNYKFGYKISKFDDRFDVELVHVVRAFHFHHNQEVESQNTGWGDWNALDQLKLEDLLSQASSHPLTSKKEHYDL